MNVSKYSIVGVFSVVSVLILFFQNCSNQSFSANHFASVVESTSNLSIDEDESDLESRVSPALSFGAAKNGPIVQLSDPHVVTNIMTAGEISLGVSSDGGGYVNHFEVGDGNIVSARYGRGWQGSVRDLYHSSRYNPTQAGFSDFAGAPTVVQSTKNSIVIPPFQMPLYSDPVFDFTQNEDLVPDFVGYPDGDNSDTDGVDLELSQDDEVRSEFDYTGTYVDASSLVSEYNVSVINHSFQNTYAREPKAIFQFGAKALKDNAPVLNPIHASLDISTLLDGNQAADPTDLSKVIFTAYGIRLLTAKGYIHPLWHNGMMWKTIDYKTMVGKGNDLRFQINQSDKEVRDNKYEFLNNRLLILSKGSLTETETASSIGLYVPDSVVNHYQTIGLNMMNPGELEYQEDRRYLSAMMFTHAVDAQIGIRIRYWTEGLMAPNKARPGVAEALRNQVYILYGTPKNILQAVESGKLK